MNKKIVTVLMVMIMTMNSTIYGATNKQATKNLMTTEQIKNTQENPQSVSKEEVKVLTLDQAIQIGLENSIILQKAKNQSDLSKLINQNALDTRNTINQGADDLQNAAYLIDDGRDQVYDSKSKLDSAQAALDNGIAPQDVPINAQITIPAGQNIKQYLQNAFNAAYPGAPAEQVTQMVNATYTQVATKVQQQIDNNYKTLDSSMKKIDSSTQEYLSSKSKYDAALQFAMANVANKLSVSTISSLEPSALADLIVKMANIQDEVTSYSVNIYKNKIALSIANSYYEALKEQKLLEVKAKAAERGRVQYEMAKAAYEVGAKSKDDMLLAKSYYEGAVMNQELQLKNYNVALITLKTNINMDLKQEIKLEEVGMGQIETYDMEKGLASGLKTRLEMKMSEAQSNLYEALFQAVKLSNYSSSDNQYKEVELLKQKAVIEQKGAQFQVESDIRTSYWTMMSMGKIATTAIELKNNAQENLEIAKVKYEVGFGYDNALLKQLNLESMSGTLVEVINAEENLASIEEKQIEANNGYNLARLKYLNDIGILPYK